MTWGQLEYSTTIKQIKDQEKLAENIMFLDSIRKHDTEHFFKLIEVGADVNCIVNEETPLMVALNVDDTDLFSLLIRFNADVNHEFDGYSIAWNTIWQNKSSFFKLLVNKINRSTRDKITGKTLLMEAVNYSNLDIVKSAVIAGFDVNAKDNRGNTALHHALAKQNLSDADVEIIKFLIASGADVLSQNANGNTPEEVIKEDIAVTQTQNIQPKQNVSQGKKNQHKKNNAPKYRPK